MCVCRRRLGEDAPAPPTRCDEAHPTLAQIPKHLWNPRSQLRLILLEQAEDDHSLHQQTHNACFLLTSRSSSENEVSSAIAR